VAAPTLLATSSIQNVGTSIAISASAGSPVAGNYRLMVLFTNDVSPSYVPISASTPNGWTLLQVTGFGRANIRAWVYGQVWTPATPAGTIALNSSNYYAVLIARLSGFTLGTLTPLITNPPSVVYDTTTATHTAGNVHTQADSLRIDFWTAFYATGANSVSTVINAPAGQTASGITRPSATQGYVTRVSWEAIATKGNTGSRTATMTTAPATASLSLAIGGWKIANTTSATTMSTATSIVSSRTVAQTTASTMGLDSSGAGSGRTAIGETSTELGIASDAQRVYLTSTVLGLGSSSAGTHDGIGDVIDDVGLAPFVTGTHIAEPVDSQTTLGLVETAVARIGGGGAAPSVVDEYTNQYVPPLRPLRFMFQRIRDGRWLNWDVPLIDPEITWSLSGPTMIRGKIGPEENDVVTGIDAWGTFLHVEESGILRASAIMQPLSVQGDDLMIEAAGVHGYAIGTQFESEFSAIQIDAAECMRQLWAYLQSYPDSHLGVTLDPTTTGRLLGEPARIELQLNADGTLVMKKVEVTLDEPGFADGLTRINLDDVPPFVFPALLAMGYPLYQDNTTGQFVMMVTPMDLAMVTTGYPALSQVVELTDGSTVVEWYVPAYTYVAAKPYEIAWWNQIDVGREIENLAKQTPFDFAEVPYWTSDHLDVQQHITIGYPRLGTKRFDLRFAEDENLFAAVVLRESPSFYANQVIVRGAGEGRVSIRAQAGGDNPSRVRRVTSLTDQTITTRERALDLAVEELYRRIAAYTISEITIDATHDNAPMGAFALGDDILIQANIPYYGEVALWHRILAYSWYPDRNEVRLSLRRSEQFVYGRVLPN